MASKHRDPAKEALWRDTFKRFAASGLSVRKFCKRERLTESQFYAWRRTIGERDGESPSAPSFLPVVVSDQPTRESLIAIELVGGRVLRLPTSTPAVWLAELVLAVEARSER